MIDPAKRVAVVLAGCGVYDGSEIYESVITLLQLERNKAAYQCFAPDIPQRHVINHANCEEMAESRNVLIEAARLARGRIQPLSEARAEDFDALIVPGGFGAAKNLSDFAFAGANMTVLPELVGLAKAFTQQGKPIGLICIAPAMSAAIFGRGVRCTIGTDEATAEQIEEMGAEHCAMTVEKICVDEKRKLVTTPAYMMAESMLEAESGINKLVDKVLQLA